MAPQEIRADEYYDTVDVEDYYDKVHRTTWARRTAGFLGGATLGMLYGGIIGALGAFLPTILSTLGVAGAAAAAAAPLTLGFIASSAAICSILGAGFGITILGDVSSNSAAVSAGLEEMEKRHKVEALQNGQAVHGTVKTDTKDLPNTVKLPPNIKLFNWKVAAITTVMFAVFGAVLACTPFSVAAATLGLQGAAGVIASATIFGTWGMLMGVKNSLVTNKTTNFFFNLISNKYFEKSPEPKPKTIVPVRNHEAAPKAEVVYELPREDAISHASLIRRNSVADILAAQERSDPLTPSTHVR